MKKHTLSHPFALTATQKIQTLIKMLFFKLKNADRLNSSGGATTMFLRISAKQQ